MFALAPVTLLSTLVLSTSFSAVNALPLNSAPAPVCYKTYEDVSVGDYTMLKDVDSFSALSLKDGVLYTPLNETVAVIKDSFTLLPPLVHLNKVLQPLQTGGHFEICEDAANNHIYLQFIPTVLPVGITEITEFKLCTYENTNKLEVSLQERDTRGLSCTVNWILLKQTKVAHPTEYGKVLQYTDKLLETAPFYLRAITVSAPVCRAQIAR
jgi:hypothetical protein